MLLSQCIQRLINSSSFWSKWLKKSIVDDRVAPSTDRKNRSPNRVFRNALLSLETLESRIVPDSGGACNVLAGGDLVYNSGTNYTSNPLISAVSIHLIFLKDSTSLTQTSSTMQSQFDGFFSAIVADGYIPDLLSQYSIPGYTPGNGSYSSGSDDTSASAATNDTLSSGGATYGAYTDSKLQSIIQAEINNHHTAAQGANNLYFIFTPPGDAAEFSPGGANSINDFLGYHSAFTDTNGKEDYYAVITDQTTSPNANLSSFGLTAFQGMTQVSSHEMAEAITDPTPNSEFNDANYGEVGDMAANESYTWNGYSVQYMWSQSIRGPAFANGAGANDLHIDQVIAPAVTSFSSGPVATFTDANTSLAASAFAADVYDTTTGAFWSNVTIAGSNGHFVISATAPSGAVVAGSHGSVFNQDGLYIFLTRGAFNDSGNPISVRYAPYVVTSAATKAAMNYVAPSGSGSHSFRLVENAGAGNFELYDGANLVMTQAVAATTSINILADPSATGYSAADVNDSLTIDYSGGVFTNAVTFNGGPGTSGTHNLTFKGGAFTNETYTPSGANAGVVALDGQTVTFSSVNVIDDLSAATNFTIKGTSGADQINIVDGTTLGGTRTTEVNSNGTFVKVDFANKTNVTVSGLTGADVFTVNNPNPAAGLTTLNVDGGATTGVIFNVLGASVTTNVLAAASATINIGNSGSVQGIIAALNLDNSSGAHTSITLDDSADSTSRTVTLTGGEIQGLAPGNISYVVADTQSLTIDGGSGGNRFSIQAVGTGITTVINGGSGSDLFNLSPLATGSNLTLNGQGPLTAPGDKLVYLGPGALNSTGSGSGNISQSGQATIAYTGMETVYIGADLGLSTLSVSNSTVQSGGQIKVTFQAKDGFGNNLATGGLTVTFALGGGTGQGTFTSNGAYIGNGQYTAVFTGTTQGTNSITVTVNGQSAAATQNITVAAGTAASLAKSFVLVSASSVAAGSSVTVTLQAVDANGNDLTSGGLSVAFTLGSGAGQGTFSNFKDNYNGTYTATFTGSTAGANTMSATIGGQALTSTAPGITVTGSVVVADFPGYGLFEYSSGKWVQLTPADPASFQTDASGDIFADFRGYGFYEYTAGAWAHLTPSDPSSYVVSSGNAVAADFQGYGLYEYNGTTFVHLNSSDPTSYTADAAGDVFADYRGYGLYELTLSNTVRLSAADPNSYIVNAAGDLVADYFGYGLYEYKASNFVRLTPADATSYVVDPAGDVFADFRGYGLYEFTQSQTIHLNASDPTSYMVDAAGDLFADFHGYGLYEYTSSNWVNITPADPTSYTVTSTGILVADFQGYGMYEYRNGSLSQLTPTDPTGAYVVDAEGDVVANFAGYGVYEYSVSSGKFILTTSVSTSTLMIVG